MNTPTTLRKLTAIFVLAVLPLFSVSLFAQQYTLSNTTLNGAITSSATTLVLGSASASSGSSFGAPAAGQCLWVDAELMVIQSMSSTTATVRRGRSPASHANSAVIFTGSCNAFKSADPILGDNAVCSGQPAPWVNVNNANVWWCNTATSKWTGTNFQKVTFGSVPVAQ